MFWIGMLIGAMIAAPVGFLAACVMSSGKAADQEAEDVFEQMQRDARNGER